jgi:ubiquinone/menaquinone biosynthesis C-methylase UbiE
VSFKDHFSSDSQSYSDFRPAYPDELFRYLAAITPQQNTAWDCATGSGQAAGMLANYFAQVVATDASDTQIKHAVTKENIRYEVALAEQSGIASASIDLITVAQALHWFKLDEFATETNRVLTENGILAAWTYNLLSINDEIDALINNLYFKVVGDYWDFERSMVEDGYRNVSLPFKQIDTPAFTMSAQWGLQQLIGYLNTWSAVKAYTTSNGENPADTMTEELTNVWSTGDALQTVNWPLSLRVWQKTTL